jgi:Cytochrome c7 and related cytochrome c
MDNHWYHKVITFGAVLLLSLSFLVSCDVKADSICEAYRPLHSTYGLTGYHATSLCSCSSCHLSGVWKGTPTSCATCHSGTRPPAIGKTVQHIPSSAECSTCHTTTVFSNATMVHNATTSPPGSCATCHNGAFTSQNAVGKPRDHPVTNLSCDACHSTSNWNGARFSHIGVVIGTCATCHNGTNAMGLPSNHIPTGAASCDTCHKAGFSSFAGGVYTHTGTETCENCHVGNYLGASPKPAVHPTTPNNCSNCHSITGWPCRTGALELKRKLKVMLSSM